MTETVVTKDHIMALQRALGPYGYLDAIDGKYGLKSYNATQVALAREGMAPLPPFDPLKITLPFDLMVKLGILSAPQPQHRGLFPMNVGSNWLSGIVASTAFKYVVAMIATFVASKIGVDHGTIEGILTQLIGLLMGVWGAYESAKSKVVVNGQSVQVKDLPQSDQKAVVSAVADAKGVTASSLTN